MCVNKVNMASLPGITQLTDVSKISSPNVAATRKLNSHSISEMCCANSFDTLKWPGEVRYANAPTTHSINRAAMRCQTTATCIIDGIAIVHGHMVVA